MKFRFLVPASLLLVLFVAACTPAPNVRDDAYLKDISLVTGNPCEAPCWNNITPGETSWDDAVEIIENDERFTGIEEIAGEGENAGALALTWQDSDGPVCCQMFSRDGETVDTMFLLLAPQLSVGEVFEVVGEPEMLTGEEVTEDQALLSVIYPDVPMVIYVFVAGRAEGAITASSEVVGTIYMTDNDMQEILNNTDLYAWDGYQSYEDYIDGEYDFQANPGAESTSEAGETGGDDETTSDE